MYKQRSGLVAAYIWEEKRRLDRPGEMFWSDDHASKWSELMVTQQHEFTS